jgi:hypothetical protein
MSKQQGSRLEQLAVAVALYPAARRNDHALSAYVHWELVEAIRAELDARGYDWRAESKRLGAQRQGAALRIARGSG